MPLATLPQLALPAVNVLKAVSSCPTVCRVYCATANPTAVVVGRDGGDRRGILGVLDGFCPLGVENEAGARGSAATCPSPTPRCFACIAPVTVLCGWAGLAADQQARKDLLRMIGYKR